MSTENGPALPGASTFRLSDFTSGEEAGDKPVGIEEEKPESEREPEAEAEAPEGAEAEESEPEPEPEKPRKGKPFNERVGKLLGENRELKDELEYLRGRLAEGREQKPKEPEKAPAAEAAPDPASYEFGEADPAYYRDLARHEARAEFRAEQERVRAEEEQARIQAGLAELETSYAERVAAVGEKYPDFDDKVQAGAERGEWPCPPVVALGIKHSEAGPDIAYHLATNIDDAKRIAALSPLEQAREFGRLEARFLDTPKSEPEKKVTKAPPPPSQHTRGSGGQFESSERALYKKMLSEFH